MWFRAQMLILIQIMPFLSVRPNHTAKLQALHK